jgi:glutamate dehydrogenase
MNQTNPLHAAATAGDDPGLEPLHRLYARHAPGEGAAADDRGADGALCEAARTARTIAALRPLGQPLIEVRSPSAEVATTTVEIIADDLPYLVESLLIGLGRVGARARRVIHPVLVVRRAANGALLEVLTPDDAAPTDASRETWIHLELEPFPADETDDLVAELRGVLGDLREVVEDRDQIVGTATAVAAELLAQSPPGNEGADAARLLTWLTDGHFTFLGYRRYAVDPASHEPRLRPVPTSGLGVLRRDHLAHDAVEFTAGTDQDPAGRPLLLARASTPSRVIRPAYPSHLAVSTFDSTGRITGEHRFLGMLSPAALRSNVLDIPAIDRRVRSAIAGAGFPLESYGGQRMLEVISDYPREELFWTSERGLRDVAVGVLSLNQPRRLRLFLQREPYRRFFSCLVYLPRDRYSTRARLALQQVLLRELHGWRIDHSARISESSLALVHFTVQTGRDAPEPDQPRLQAQLAAAILTWDEWLLDVARAGDEDIADYLVGVPQGYKDDVDPVRALADLRRVRGLHPGDEPLLSLEPGADPDELRLRLFLAGAAITLSAVLPMLQSLGVEVLDERAYPIDRPDGIRCWIYDFGLRVDEATGKAIRGRAWPELRREFCAAFAAIWRGDAEVDRFNALVLHAAVDWRQAALLRAYAAYTRQLGAPFPARYVADTLIVHPEPTRGLLALFSARFDPAAEPDARERAHEEALNTVSALIDQVMGLDADRILRGYLTAILATLRTNYFRSRSYLAIKLDPLAIPEMPQPRPRFEIFVYSPRLEGVHLRFGPVARGGLRWSDRPQDYRTEILGLVKAQAVKNSVIVPLGAKGGFVIKAPHPDLEQARAGYRTFIRGLLDLTDNRVGDAAVPPPATVCHDGADSYLVVAADKGTASFSDTANEVAASYDFWLGDAFASGGSVGYDHKAMGITARGAWESVKRHFRELGVDTQSERFTVVGVGDMSGDVFGNGMLLSEHILLLAAFDHRHIFVDPRPDPSAAFAERRRLAALPHSSWADYDRAVLSPGGGIWPRTLKSVPIGPEIRAALALRDGVTRLTPPELVRAILLAPADLLWNAGIGTYVKARAETPAAAGDKANDAVRVDAADLRVKVVGEGGNLGLTQRGRIEFAAAGGKLNTDAVDNSAGVDCSDHEVNIKILLDQLVASGALSRSQRNRLLREMTSEVAELVLADNRAQNAELGIARATAADMVDVHARMVADLVARRGLDRDLELFPDPTGFTERARAGLGLTSPELCTLLAHVKLDLKTEILGTELPDLPEFAARLAGYFPAAPRQRFPAALADHPLRREILATALVNDMVDQAGMSFAFRLGEDGAASVADAVRAYLAGCAVFGLPGLWAQIRGLPAEVPIVVIDELMGETRRLLDAVARWLLAHRPRPLAVAEETARLKPPLDQLTPRVPGMVRGQEAEALARRADTMRASGVPAALATRVAALPHAVGLLDIIEISQRSAPRRSGLSLEAAADLYFTLSDRSATATPWAGGAARSDHGALARVSARLDELAAEVREELAAARAGEF